MNVNIEQKPSQAKLAPAVQANLEEVFFRVCNPTAKRKLWVNHFTEADRAKFKGSPMEVLEQYSVPVLWHVARGTPNWNECLVEVGHALGFINGPRRDGLLAALGARGRGDAGEHSRERAVPVWDEEASELLFQGRVVRKVLRPNQAQNIVAILREFQAKGWPPRIDDPRGRESDDEKRRRDISSINKLLDTSVLKFFCDGYGTGFRWQRVEDASGKTSAKRRRSIASPRHP
jgi:hypothetical protein